MFLLAWARSRLMGAMHDVSQIDPICELWRRNYELVGAPVTRFIVSGNCKKESVDFSLPFFYVSVHVFDPVADIAIMMRDLAGMLGRAFKAEKVFTTLNGENGEVVLPVRSGASGHSNRTMQ